MKTNHLAAFRRFAQAWLIAAVCIVCGVARPVVAQESLEGFRNPLRASLSGKARRAEPEIKVTTKVEPTTAKPGDKVTLSITVEVSAGAYLYSMNPDFGGGSRVKFEAQEGIDSVSEFVADHPPKVEFSKEFNQNIEKYAKAVTWTKQYRMQPGVTSAHLKGILNYQVCDDGGCRLLKHAFDITVPNEAGTVPVAKRQVEPTAAAADRFEFKGKLRHKNAQATMRLVPVDARPGDTVSLEFNVKLEEGWHIFSTTQPDGNAASPTEFTIDSHVGLEAVDPDFVPSREFQIHIAKIESKAGTETNRQEIYEHDVTWSRKFRLLPGTELPAVKVTGKVLFQVCKDGFGCIPNSVKFTLPAVEVASAPPPTRGSSNPAVAEGNGGEHLTPVPEAPAGAAPNEGSSKFVDASEGECVSSTADGDIRDRGVLYVLGAAFVFGWLALLTPCVFPMVPITVSFFLKQAEKKNNSPLKMALVYCASIIGTFTVMGLMFSALFGASYINTLANGVMINLFLGVVLLFFALNLLGLFDIQIPSWLLTFTASKESTSSYFGVFFMALTFTLTSFTCTFAFLGLILVWAANGEFWWPLGGLVAFSTAFAMPFFLLALFPSYLHKLPKSGGWMNRVKVVMGLIEMAFMFKFLSVADIAWNSTPTIFDYHLVMAAWTAIAIVAGLYLLGKIQLPHDTKEDYVGVLPMVVAIGFFSLAGYLSVGLFSEEPPAGFFGQQIVAFAPPRLNGGVGEDGPFLIDKHDGQPYLLDFERAIAKAKREQIPLFIDFTGVNCINCRRMEAMMGQSSSIQGHLNRMVRVKLYTDVMPNEAVGDLQQSEKLLEFNRNLMDQWIKSATLPGYAVASPNGMSIFSKAQGMVQESNFSTFLQCGLNKWERNKRAEVAVRK